MNNQFKPGDLALIVGCYRDPEDIGKVVELQEFVQPGQLYCVDGMWLCCGDTSPGWICLSAEVVAELVSSAGIRGHVLVDEKHLMPLRGDFRPEQQKSREVPA